MLIPSDDKRFTTRRALALVVVFGFLALMLALA